MGKNFSANNVGGKRREGDFYETPYSITQQLLAECHKCFRYDPETGNLYWRIKRGKKAVGDLAGTSSKGYIVVKLNYKVYFAHRIIWLMVYGNLPKNLIDHINTDRHDNRLHNLREATHSQNKANTRISIKNTSGYRGITTRKTSKGITIYEVNITFNGRLIYLGRFLCVDRAAKYQRLMSKILFGEYTYDT